MICQFRDLRARMDIMSATSTATRWRVRGAISVGGIAAIAGISLLAAPGTALASAVTASGITSAGAVRPADTYQQTDHVIVDTRVVTLWYNEDTGAFHAEIADGGAGDVVHLDYTANPNDRVKGKYSIASATITSPHTFVNTSDQEELFARACGFVGGGDACTSWYRSPG
jgi:hypothetical protein